MTEPSTRVAIARAGTEYPEHPWDPSDAYPEYRGGKTAGTKNSVYEGVRESLRLVGLDAERFGTPEWSPFRDLVKPGDRVFIKPNLVTHEYRKSCGCPGDLFSVITHPAVLRAVADYVAIALDGRGEIVIGDNPCIDADFELMKERTGIHRLAEVYGERFDTQCRVLDLRPKVTKDLTYYGFRSKTTPQSGDPDGASILNLGKQSFFYGLNPLLYRGVFTKRLETIRHHFGRRQEYSVSNTILNSDVYISVPKLKAHHKVGTTLNVKGLVGINHNKNFLVHWRIGFPNIGGDEFPAAHRRFDTLRLMARHVALDLLPEPLYIALRRRLKGGLLDRALQPKKKSSHEAYRGAWDGNDTCWRMAADLYNLFIADVTGRRQRIGKEQRHFTVIDGVCAGEGNGPFCPTTKRAGVVLASHNLLAADTVATRLMDYRVRRVRYLEHLMAQHGLEPDSIEVVSDHLQGVGFFQEDRRYLEFAPPTGWPDLSLLDPRRDSGGGSARDGSPRELVLSEGRPSA